MRVACTRRRDKIFKSRVETLLAAFPRGRTAAAVGSARLIGSPIALLGIDVKGIEGSVAHDIESA